MTSIEKAILEALNAKPRDMKKESRDDYFTRLCEGLSDLDDETHDALPDGVKKWEEQAIKALEANKAEDVLPFIEFEDTEDEPEEEEEPDEDDDEPPSIDEEEESENEPEEEVPQPKTKAKAKKETKVAKKKVEPKKKKAAVKKEAPTKKAEVEKKPAKKTEPKKATGEGRGARGGKGVADIIRDIMCRDPGVTKAEVAEELKKRKVAHEEKRLIHMYHTTRLVFDKLREHGKLK